MKRLSLWTVWKLRLKLWWMFAFNASSNHRLKIRWNDASRNWYWICEVPAMRINSEYSLGPLQQWTLQEALNLAARKAEWILHPEQEPVKEPEPKPTIPQHTKVYRLHVGGQFTVECSCGWTSIFLRCHSETDAWKHCDLCAQAEKSYDQHMVGPTIPVTSVQTGKETVNQ